MINVPSVVSKFGNGRIIALDIEHTGGKKETRKIIQLGVIELKDGKFKAQYSKTFGGGKSNFYALQVHKISDRSRAGMELFEEVCPKIAKYFSNSILIGHNILSCDIKIIEDELIKKKCIIENYSIIDTYRLALNILPSGAGKLEECCKELNLEYGAHDALGDARSCLLLLEELVKIKHEEDADFFISKKEVSTCPSA